MFEPTDPLPESIYRRRRLFAAGAAVLGVALTTYLVAAVAGGADRPDPAGSVRGVKPADTLDREPPASSPPATMSPAGPSSSTHAPAADPSSTQCRDEEISLVAEVNGVPTELPRIKAGHHPTLRLVITNTGRRPCRRDVGGDAQQLMVTTATGTRVWSSDDCNTDGSRDDRVLTPGERIVSQVSWSAIPSRPGCVREKARVDPGAYLLIPRLGELTGRAAPFTIER